MTLKLKLFFYAQYISYNSNRNKVITLERKERILNNLSLNFIVCDKYIGNSREKQFFFLESSFIFWLYDRTIKVACSLAPSYSANHPLG
jgi:hypothetical protein